MPALEGPLVENETQLEYVRGWCYHDQLGSLNTDAPHILPSPDSLPAGMERVWEQEITRSGFLPSQNHAASYLYRANPGTAWEKDGIKGLSVKGFCPHWVTGRIEPPLIPSTHRPRKYRAVAPAQAGVLEALTTLFYNQDLSVGITTGTAPMPYFFRNADGDDLYFAHRGEGFCETELGILHYREGHFFWIPKGIAYRLVPRSGLHELFHMENYGEKFSKPDTGIAGDSAIYYHRNIEVPKAHYVGTKGTFKVIVKANGTFTRYAFPFHPMDVVGWDGTLFPFRLHINDIRPITSWRAHLAPSVFCTFLGDQFELCSFVERPVETGERSLPVPFDHINVDRDEVIFYSRGVFFSKAASSEGSWTYHPRGPSHGPHRESLFRAEERRKKEGAFMFEGKFLLLETTRPLFPTAHAKAYEEGDYVNSWQ